ncbi:MAG TPA: CAP domain-containing protein [Frankiaceae bacterium]|nr:CAP domain-containing protein [Frankiaceae bacterium]
MVRKLAALLLAPALLLGLLGVTNAAAADSNASAFVARANAARESRGLRPYVVRSDLIAVAARHSARMADKNSLYHNPNLGSEVDGWEIVGENVGTGGTVDAIHDAFMRSQKHRANILARDYTEIGVATVTDARGAIWVTQVFRLPYRAPKAKAPALPQVPRTVVRVPVQRRPVLAAPARPAQPVAPLRPARPAAPRLVTRPDATAFAGALAPAAPDHGATGYAGDDPFGIAVAYADTLTALSS